MEYWFLLCINSIFCFLTYLSIAAGIFTWLVRFAEMSIFKKFANRKLPPFQKKIELEYVDNSYQWWGPAYSWSDPFRLQTGRHHASHKTICTSSTIVFVFCMTSYMSIYGSYEIIFCSYVKCDYFLVGHSDVYISIYWDSIPFQHVIKYFAQILSTKTLIFHFFIIVHLALTNLPIIELVPLGLLISNPTDNIQSTNYFECKRDAFVRCYLKTCIEQGGRSLFFRSFP